ncbi:MAG: uroporphyrinogen-III synthase [Thermaceae bacterium]
MVVLTRQKEKNKPLREKLEALGIGVLELPLLVHQDLPGLALLPERLSSSEWVAVTSPEGAKRLLWAWEQAGRLPLRVAAVGEGTGEVLKRGGLVPALIPERATGRDLGEALGGLAKRVLFVASALAEGGLEEVLRSKGVEVERLEVYTTLEAPLGEVPWEDLRRAEVVALASPSAVRVWKAHVGLDLKAGCIGPSTAKEARKTFSRVYEAASPGLEGLLSAILLALEDR